MSKWTNRPNKMQQTRNWQKRLTQPFSAKEGKWIWYYYCGQRYGILLSRGRTREGYTIAKEFGFKINHQFVTHARRVAHKMVWVLLRKMPSLLDQFIYEMMIRNNQTGLFWGTRKIVRMMNAGGISGTSRL